MLKNAKATCVLVFACAAVAAVAQDARSFLPDLTFNFDCKGESYPISDHAIESFLRENDFRAMNVVQFRHQRGLSSLPYDTFIDGTNRPHQMVRFRSVPFVAGSYSVGFYTPPPTQHDKAMEQRIITFVSDTLRCTEREVSRNENRAEKYSYYEEFFKVVESRVREANGEL